MEPTRLPARHNSGESFAKCVAQLSSRRLTENEDYFTDCRFHEEATARPNESGSPESLRRAIASRELCGLPGGVVDVRAERMRGCEGEIGDTGVPVQGSSYVRAGQPAEWTGDRAGRKIATDCSSRSRTEKYW